MPLEAAPGDLTDTFETLPDAGQTENGTPDLSAEDRDAPEAEALAMADGGLTLSEQEMTNPQRRSGTEPVPAAENSAAPNSAGAQPLRPIEPGPVSDSGTDSDTFNLRSADTTLETSPEPVLLASTSLVSPTSVASTTAEDGSGTPHGTELHQFEHNLHTARANLDDLKGRAERTEDLISKVRWALEQVEQVEEQSDSFLSSIKSMRFTLKVTEKAGPLRVASKLLDNVLENLEDVATRITYHAGRLRKKIEDGNYIQKLEDAEAALSDAQDFLGATEERLQSYETTAQLAQTVFANSGTVFDPLEGGIETTLAPVNTALEALNGTYLTLASNFDALTGGFFAAEEDEFTIFEVIDEVAVKFGQVNGAIAFLTDPLKAAHSALKPIEWALDLAGAVFDLTVGPVLDWLLETLGINDIFDRIADAIASALPDVNILGDLVDDIDGALGVFSPLGDFLDTWNPDIGQFRDDILAEVVDRFNAASTLELRFGTENSETLPGRDDTPEILNGLEGNDLVQGAPGGSALAEADIFMASGGKDTLEGGASTDDWLILPRLLSQFRIVKVSDSAPLVFNDLSGKYGFEVVTGIENFAFLDGFYTEAELLASGVVQDGGSDLTDDLLIGSGEDELFVHTDGLDSIDALGGTDTWVFEEDPNFGSQLRIELSGGFDDTEVPAVTWEGKAFVGDANNYDFLSGIEDIIIQDDTNVSLLGSSANNALLANDSDDLVLGYDGDDYLVGNAGRDFLIGGLGSDTLSGGSENDTLFGGPAAAGETNRYDGGTGLDRLVYSTNRSDYDLDSPTNTNLPTGALDASGPLRIYAATGRIQHLSADLSTVIATDIAENIETFVGSDSNDTIRGADLPGVTLTIDGGGGDDFLYSDGARQTNGGAGDDRLIATGSYSSFNGGGGIDTLDLRGFDNVRWSINNNFGATADFRAIEDIETEDLVNRSDGAAVIVPATVFSGSYEAIDVLLLGEADDTFYNAGLGSTTIYGYGGDDTLIRKQANDGSHRAVFYGGEGNDYLELVSESGALYGGVGDDTIRVDVSGEDYVFSGGEGDDLFSVRRLGDSILGRSLVSGGSGYDTLTFDPQFITGGFETTRVIVNLVAGTVDNLGSYNAYAFDVSGIEAVVGIDGVASAFTGTGNGERFVGRSGNDTLIGGGGGDELYGGDAGDVLVGDGGSDLIHGGLGDDTIQGGDDIDTLSYSQARPGGARGEVVAGNFGAVSVNLGRYASSGVFGSDQITGIENVIGGMGDDTIVGDDGDNALSGGEGIDRLLGGAGDDVLNPGDGDDVAYGGAGNDTFLLNSGFLTAIGGEGIDQIDFSPATAAVSVDTGQGNYFASLLLERLVWADDQSEGVRVFGGVSMTPRDVLETDLAFANDPGDLTRVLPTTADYAADETLPRFDIVTVSEAQSLVGRIAGIEKVTGSAFDDVFFGNDEAETFHGGNGDDRITGRNGNDTIHGENGDDSITGGAGGGTGPAAPVDLLLLNEVSPFTDYAQQAFSAMPTDGFTLEIMVESLPLDRDFTLFSYGVADSTNEITLISVGLPTPRLILILNGQVVELNVPSEMVFDGAPHRLSLTWDSAAAYVQTFVDGLSVSGASNFAGTDIPIGASGVVVIGQDQDGATPGNTASYDPNQAYRGGVGDIRLFDYTRSAAEIWDNAKGLLPGDPATEPGLVANWRADAGASTFVDVVSGTPMTIGGTVGFTAGVADPLSDDDNLLGGAGNDTLRGGAGEDILIGGAGADLLDGGLDIDRASYAGSRAIRVDLQVPGVNSGDATGDTFFGIENLSAGSGNDSLAGDGQNNAIWGFGGFDTLVGRLGDDTLNGGDQNDVLLGGAGADLLIGGAGFDRASYSGAGAGVVADMLSVGLNTGDAAGDRYVDIEFLSGSDYGDSLRGSDTANRIWGFDGDDVLYGRAGADVLSGGNGDDVLEGGAQGDQLVGGAGNDRASYSTAAAGVLADLQNAGANTGDAAGDSYSGIAWLSGSGHDDNLRGDGADNRIWGFDGVDRLYGRDGDDVLSGGDDDDLLDGGAGADTLIGGVGTDRAIYASSTQALVIDMINGARNTGDAAGDRFIDVEEISGTSFNDEFHGDDMGNRLIGRDGFDALYGRGGDDRLEGGALNDVLDGGAGADTLDGGDGIDRARYGSASAGVTADLMFRTRNTGDAAGDFYLSIEFLSGSDFDDTLRGTDGANRIWGFDGGDLIYGRGGGDVLIGGIGDDVIDGGTGADSIYGQDGEDRASYGGAATAVVADLQARTNNTGEAAGDFYVQVENLSGSSFGDSLRGDGAGNKLYGQDGNDTLYGRNGNDTLSGGGDDDILSGGAGNDAMIGGLGADQFVFDGGSDRIIDFVDNVDTVRLDDALWGGGVLTGAQIVSTYGGVVAGNAVLDFGGGDVLSFIGLATPTALENDITVF